MFEIDYKKPVHIYFIGIGGISMSGLAHVLHDKGFVIAGSDKSPSAQTDMLKEMGISVGFGEDENRILNPEKKIDVVVYTAAIHPDNPEYMAAKERGIPMLTRAQLLGQIMRFYKKPAAIAGTHGKTTTTSMLSQILLEADVDPTLSIGGNFPPISGNIRAGNSDFFVTEACEYTNSFLDFYPFYSVILNVEADHLDYFKNLNDIIDSFHRFADLTPSDGALVIAADCQGFSRITGDLSCRVITFGAEDGIKADYMAKDISYDENACASFYVECMDVETKNDKVKQKITLAVPGLHNVKNALAAIACADLYNIPRDITAKALLNFKGTARRFEYKGEKNGFNIIDDYAHHPTEIKATLKAANKIVKGELYVIFQPHTYTRTKVFFNEFVDALSLADHVLIAPVYAARETETLGVDIEEMAKEISVRGCDADAFTSFSKIEDYCLENCVSGDLVITMGAGDIFKVGDNLLQR